MYFLTYEHKNIEKVGILGSRQESVIAAEEIIKENPPHSMLELIIRLQDKNILEAIRSASSGEGSIGIDEVRVKSPIPNPLRNVICVGKNYSDHIKEIANKIDGKSDIPQYPIYFSKMVDRILGPCDFIPSQSYISDKLDYESELAVVIGKEGKDIPYEKVEEYIFGYSVLNDISVRDVQNKHVQWFRGKSLDGTCSMGPYIVHKSMIPYPPELNIACTVNGETRQDSNTRNFIFNISTLISDFSRGITLRPGDIIATGTPAGVGMGFNPEKYLKHGDIVECGIEKIGILKNIVD
jgi:2-keto-4-pentenoate hydratase/2-oxohepta-3-ene-1,7-dioic acid hydratase in catechol pathway